MKLRLLQSKVHQAFYYIAYLKLAPNVIRLGLLGGKNSQLFRTPELLFTITQITEKRDNFLI
jgi:hypothetical protein